MKHKHAELIKAWADGAKIQCANTLTLTLNWLDVPSPKWLEHEAYRIKPEEKKPVVRYLWADKNGFMTANLYSENERQQQLGNVESLKYHVVRLDWSRTEFKE